MQRKVIYAIIAVIVAMAVLSIEMCRKKCPPEIDIKHSLDSLQYVHEVNLCNLEKIISKRDTITKIVTKIKTVENRVTSIEPVYSSDSLILKILEIINTDQNNLEL